MVIHDSNESEKDEAGRFTVSTERTRLDEIRERIESGGCDQCEGAADLLAVVEAVLGRRTVAEMVDNIRESLLNDYNQHDTDERDAWEALT